MAKSDLLKEAIADAKAVKETALANAKIALEEAFQPRIKNMLENELMNELEHDEMDMDGEMDMEPAGDEMEMDAMADEGEPMDVGDVSIDTDMDGDVDFTGDIMATSDMEPEMDDMDDMGAQPEMSDMGAEDDLELEEIIRELEEDMHEDEEANEMYMEIKNNADGSYSEEVDEDAHNENMHESIDELIEAILSEEEEEEIDEDLVSSKIGDGGEPSADSSSNAVYEAELKEAYDTVKHLKSVINEVNLLNAKLLYTNKLFRNFDLNEGQKMKVIENFDRAANTREAKLVFSTLAESFQTRKSGKKIVKESRSMASRPVAGTAPSKKTTQVLTEGFEQANRWKKLAGMI